MIAGRETYDTSVPWWGPDGPTGPARRPVFVVTHRAPADSPEGGVYTFVTGGIERALEQARAAVGDRTVGVMGGASIGQLFLAAGLVDEIQVHLVPVLFGSGTHVRAAGPGPAAATVRRAATGGLRGSGTLPRWPRWAVWP